MTTHWPTGSLARQLMTASDGLIQYSPFNHQSVTAHEKAAPVPQITPNNKRRMYNQGCSPNRKTVITKYKLYTSFFHKINKMT